VIACPDGAVAGEAVRVVVVVVCCGALALTWIDKALEVEAASALFPAYDAVMLCVPPVSDAIVKVTVPFDREAIPSDVEPSSSVTVPEGVGPAVAVTPTLKTTLCPAVI
jgi:hypothetical protein